MMVGKYISYDDRSTSWVTSQSLCWFNKSKDENSANTIPTYPQLRGESTPLQFHGKLCGARGRFCYATSRERCWSCL